MGCRGEQSENPFSFTQSKGLPEALCSDILSAQKSKAREGNKMEQLGHLQTIRDAVVFSGLREDPVILALTELLENHEQERSAVHRLCCDLARALYPFGDNLTDYILEAAICDENIYIDRLARGGTPSQAIEQQAAAELHALSMLGSLNSDYFVERFKLEAHCPKWSARRIDLAAEYAVLVKNAPKRGYGIFAKHHVFRVTEDGSLAPVHNPDPQRLCDFHGYESERGRIIENTLALLQGLPANNVLLYGDAGTGKSSTVKAIANEYKSEGLRLIQAEKALLRHIPALLDFLAEKPLRFIIFIDDLSFETSDRDFTALKTVLEGSVAARAQNTLVYATSNRRHLLRESFAARQGDEVHLSDTLEEAASLAARFGLVVTFTRPDKDDFLELVWHFADNYRLDIPESELITGAEAYAIRSGGRSPRLAKQYIELLLSKRGEN